MNRSRLPKPPRPLTALPAVVGASLSLVLHGVVPWLGGAAVRPEPARVSIEIHAVKPPPASPLTEVEPEAAPAPAPKAPPAPKPRPDPVAKAPPPPPSPAPPPEVAVDAAPAAESAEVQQAAAPAAEVPPDAPTPMPVETNEPAALAAVEVAKAAPPRRPHPVVGKHFGPHARFPVRKGGRRGPGRKPIRRAEGPGAGASAAVIHERDPEAVYACTATELGHPIDVRKQRPLNDWVTVVPTVLVPFETRPVLGDYLDGVAQIVSRKQSGTARKGMVEVALPAEVLQMELDAPADVRIALGNLQGRCLVGLRYSQQLFPITLEDVPLRVIDRQNRTTDSLVRVTLYKDGSFALTHRGGEPLAFTEGRLQNANAIKQTIENHYAAARLVREVAGWFGIDLRKSKKGSQREPSRSAGTQVAKRASR